MIYNVADLFSCLNDGPGILYAMRSPKSFEDPDCKDLVIKGFEKVEKWLIDNQNATVNNFEIERESSEVSLNGNTLTITPHDTSKKNVTLTLKKKYDYFPNPCNSN